MKILLIILILTAICLPISVANSQTLFAETDDTENVAEVENTTHPVIDKAVSTPRAIFNFFKSHYDGGLVFETKNGNFRLRYTTLIQYQFSATNNDNSSSTDTELFFRRIRLNFQGHAFRPWLHYRLQFSRDNVKLGQVTDGSGVDFNDFYFDAVRFIKIFPRVGKFNVPFNREQLNPGSALLLVERSIVNSEFSYGRKIGAALYGLLGDHVAYGGSVFISPTIEDATDASTINSEVFAGRIQLNFGGKLEYANGHFPTGGDYALVPNFANVPTFVSGVALLYFPSLNVQENDGDSGALVERFMELGIEKGDVTSVTADVSYKQPSFNIEAAYIGRWIDPEIGGGATVYDQGFRVQTGLFLLPDLIEIAGRWAFISYDTSPGVSVMQDSLMDNSSELTSGINYYISKSNSWKLQLSYSFISDTFTQGAPNEDQKTLRLQMQVQF